ncbi:dentin sialophosphoprotein-like [Clytia hemisphaerica]
MDVKPVSPRRKTVRDEPQSNDSKTNPSINPVAKKFVKNETSNSKTNINASSPPSVRPTRKIFKDTSYLKPSESETELNKPSNDNYKGIESTINPIPPTEDDQQKSGESPKVSQGTAKFPVTFTPDPPRKVITSIDKSKDTQSIVASTEVPKPVLPRRVVMDTAEEPQTLSPQSLPTRPENRNLNDVDKPNNTTPQFPVTFTPDQPRKVYRDKLLNNTPKPATEASTSATTSEPSSYHIGELPLMPATSSEPELPPRRMSKETDPFDGITLRSNSTATIDIDDKERLIASDSDRSSSEIPSDNHQDISMNDRTSPTLESPTEFEIHNVNASSKENLVEAQVTSKSKGNGKGSFRLPGLDELRSKTLRRNKKGSDQNVSLIQHVIHDDGETDEGESGLPKRGGSVRVKGSSSQMKSQDDDHKPIKRSLSTGQTIREKLGNSGNSLRSGISRIGNSVTSRGLTKKASVEEKQGLISEDPDENTDFLVRIKDEEKTKEKEAEMSLESRPPKEKRRLIGGQSVTITSPKDQQPSIPSYKKLGENSEPSQPLFPTSPICDEQPTEVYKPLSASPKLGSKKSNEDENRVKNELNTKKSEWSTGSKISWEKQKLLDNPDFNQGFSSHQDNYSYNGLNQESQKLMTDENSTNLKPNVDNPYQPQRSDNDDLVISNESSTMTKYGDNHTEYGQNDAPLKRSLTWNSFKSPFRGGKSLKKAKSRDTVEEDSVVENQFTNTDKKGGSYTPLAIRRAFSIKTFTPKLGRRRVDEKGRILDDKGCAKRNILSSLSLFSSSKSLNKQTELLDSDSEDDMQTELYESSFKKTNARNASQNSWLGKSGLLDSDEQPKSPNTFDSPSPALSGDQQRLNGTTASKSGAPSGGQGATAKPKGERQHLLQDDSEDSDEDLCLDRSIRSKSKNHKDLKDNRDKTNKKSSKLGGGLPSFRKKYSFDKL